MSRNPCPHQAERTKVLSPSSPLFTLSCVIWAVGPSGPPLCRGCAPATPPSKTIAQQPYAFIPAARLKQGAGGQPNTLPNGLNGSGHETLVKTATYIWLSSFSWPFYRLSTFGDNSSKCNKKQDSHSQNQTVSRPILLFSDQYLYHPKKVFFAALRGKKGVLRGPPWTKRCSSRPFAALRGQKRCSSRPFATLRGQKRCSSRPFATLRGQKRCSSRPFAPLRGQKRCSSRPFVAF